MYLSTRRLCADCRGYFLLGVLAMGCGQPAATPVQILVAEDTPQAPSEIELSEPKVTLVGPTLVRFEVKYRFVKGKPSRFYSCDISFPGTPNRAVKRMQSWELKEEGVIKDGIELKGPVTSFEIFVAEAPNGRDAYQKISNVVKGPVE